MARRNYGTQRSSRKQVTQIAVLAFVAADCAGIYYVQHRLNGSAEAAAELAYQTPGAADMGSPAALTFTPDRPMLAVAAPVTAAPAGREQLAASPLRTASAPALALASAAPAVPRAAVLAHSAAASAPAAAPMEPKLAIAAPAHPLRAPRIAPLAGLGAARMAVAAPAAPPLDGSASALGKSASANAAADSPFANAFSLYDEAPDSEHRFGQDTAGTSGPSSGSLADLITPREVTAPMFDKAGAGTVTGQAATVDAPAPTDLPADAAAAELAPIKG